MKKRIIIAALAVAAMVGCQKEKNQEETNSSGVVTFSSSSIATTRTTQILDGETYVDAWNGNDRVGISSDGYTSNGFVDEFFNVEYAVEIEEPSVSVDFTVLGYDNAPLKPAIMTNNITYYAYYPYTSNVDENGYIPVDISKQNSNANGEIGDADFMVAKTEITKPEDNVTFEFKHALSKVIFNVTFSDEVTIRDEDATLDNLKAEITAISTAKYDRDGNYIENVDQTGSAFFMSRDIDRYNDIAIFTSILHPAKGNTEKIVFYIGDSEYTVSDLTSLEFKSNYIQTYNIILGRDEALFTDISIKEWNSSSPSEDVSADIITPATYWDGEAAETFNGVAFDPDSEIKEYKISSGSELYLLSNLVTAGNLMDGITFTLTENFTLSDRNWTPIMKSSSNVFQGTFDGNGYTISGLYLNNDRSYCGLFGLIGSEATIKNLTVQGSMVVYNSRSEIGGITGRNSGTVENCISDVTITTSDTPMWIGGVAGINTGTVTGCYNIGDITGYKQVGGVVGYNSSGTVSNCYNTGETNGTEDIGGVVGNNESNGAAQKSTVEQSFNTGAVKGEKYIGGVVGYNYDYGTISAVYNTGEISGTSYVGGITGYNGSNSTITAAYNTAKVSGTEHVGGVIGYNLYYAYYVFSCYNGSDGTNSIYGSNDSNISYSAIFSSPSANITISDTSKSLVDWLNTGSSGSWESDTNSVNNGFPILTTINY